MRLYLVRHGEAKPAEEDRVRPLSEQGRRDVQKVADFLAPLGLRVSAVWHSGKTRAAQTAEILAAALVRTADGGDKGDCTSASSPRDCPLFLLRRDGLDPTDPVEPVAERIADFSGDLMIVGHMPLLGRLAAWLVNGRDAPELAAFRPGAILCLEGGGQEPWRVMWMLVPEIIPSEPS